MRYLGSKLRLFKHLLPFIQLGHTYIEPFVGSCGSMFQVVHNSRIGIDIDHQLIAMWQSLQNGWIPPEVVTEYEYYHIKENQENYPPELISFVKYACSYAAKEWGGYAKDEISRGEDRNYALEAKNLLLKKLKGLQNVEFFSGNYFDFDYKNGSTIYCDPPYAGTTKYKTDSLNYDYFWQWIRDKSEENYVYVSEYTTPDDFKTVWQKDVKVSVDNSSYKSNKEKLVVLKNSLSDPQPQKQIQVLKIEDEKLQSTVKNLFKFEELLKEIKLSTFYAIDIETNGLNLFGGHKIVGIAYYFPDTDNSYYVPVRHGVGTFSEFTDNIQKKGKKETYSKNKQILDELFQKHLQDEILFSNIPESWYQAIIQVSNENIHKQTWLAHNAQFDCIGLHLDGFELPENIYDTMLSSQVVFSDWYSVKFKMPDTGEKEPGNKRLKWLARLYKLEGAKQGEKALDEELERLNTFYKSLDDKAHTLTGDEDFKKGVLWSLDPNVVGIYAELDVRLTYELYKKQCIQMDNWNTFEVFERLCFIQRYALLRATLTGFRLDLEKAQYLIVGAKQRLEDIQSEAQEITGVENFNVGSNKQLKEYLASNGLKLPDMQQKTLEPYADNNKLIALRLEYQSVQKVVTSYIEKWYKNNNQGKIHFEFDIATKTYRLSSSSDFYNNGQNIPRNTKKELSPKNLLLPTRYDCLLEIDYKSIEMRIGAWIYETLLEGDDNFTLTNLILDGIDMHSYTRDNAEIPQILLDVYGSMEKFLLADGNDLSKIENIEEYFMQRARYLGKQTNFATMYGAGVRGLRKSLPMINAKTASLILSNWHKLYPAPSNASKKLQAIALQPRKLPNADKLGLYFEFPYPGLNPILRYDLYDTVAKNAKGGTYSPLKNVVWKSANWLPQGTASLICTYSIAKISKELGNRIDLHDMVHDSMIFSCDFNELDDILGIIVPIMTDYEVYPQLEVDIEVSRGSWGEKEHYDYCPDNT